MKTAQEKRIQNRTTNLSIEAIAACDAIDVLLEAADDNGNPVPYDTTALSPTDRLDIIHFLREHDYQVLVHVNSIEVAW